jgi:hypothetical protein
MIVMTPNQTKSTGMMPKGAVDEASRDGAEAVLCDADLDEDLR